MARVARPLLVIMVSLYFVCATHAIRNNLLKQQVGNVEGVSSIKPSLAGYITVDKDGSAIYYAYYEAQTHSEDVGEAPILLWLQGGPGCASTFGGFYELGPWSVTPELGVTRNPGAWNRIFGLLLMDQPVGTGYSRAANGSSSIPNDEMGMANHLYAALQGFFTEHHGLSSRPLFITGESYAGKYVPSIAHFILQAQLEAPPTSNAPDVDTDAAAAAAAAAAAQPPPTLQFRRPLPASVTQRPVFRLAGVAIGNGLTDPRAQTQTLAPTAYYAGLVPPGLRDDLAAKAAEVVALIDESKWREAHETRERLRSYIKNVTGIGTMFDTRRTEDYDPTKSVDRFLNSSQVKEAMRADPTIQYESCSDAVRAAMSADVMRSVKYLIPDVLAHIPVLLYQGQYDILDGVASVTSWLTSLEWPDQDAFAKQRGRLWSVGGDIFRVVADEGGTGGGGAAAAAGGNDGEATVAGWWRSAGRLAQAVVYRAGHMVPHDQPLAAQYMIEEWVLGALEASRASASGATGASGITAGTTAGTKGGDDK